jgi:hypothetical protein
MYFESAEEVPRQRERIIEDAIIRAPERLGYPGALAVRNWRVSPTSGRVDLALLPIAGPTKLVLIEAKGAVATDAASKVVGQLLMYYAGALELGEDGLSCLRRFAEERRADACDTSKKSIIKIAGAGRGIGTAEAWARLSRGAALTPREVALFVAIDNSPHGALIPTLSVLRKHHSLSIGLAVIRSGNVAEVMLPVESLSLPAE